MTSMATENLFINDGRDGQAVEAVGEGFPKSDVEAAFAWRVPYKQLKPRQCCGREW